jgi:hypothetical protein
MEQQQPVRVGRRFAAIVAADVAGYVVVISGEIDLMLEALVVHLKAGDDVVRQATKHACRGTDRAAFCLF